MTIEEIRQKILSLAALLSQPINFEDLISRGILSEETEGWYVVQDWDKLPDNAKAQIRDVARGFRVKFVS